MSGQLIAELDTNIRNHIEAEFIEISRGYLPQLRAFLTTNTPGNPQVVFNEFKRRFDSLFTLSSSKRELNKDVVCKTKEWLNKPSSYNNSSIAEGVRLFEEYKDELFRLNILKYG